MKQSFIYILASKKNGTLYVGVTSNLIRRIFQHKNNLVDGFTKKYDCKTLVYYEVFEKIGDAINREKQLKSWSRKKKMQLIENKNPIWEDLYYSLV